MFSLTVKLLLNTVNQCLKSCWALPCCCLSKVRTQYTHIAGVKQTAKCGASDCLGSGQHTWGKLISAYCAPRWAAGNSEGGGQRGVSAADRVCVGKTLTST